MEVILQYRPGHRPSTPGTRLSELLTASDLLGWRGVSADVTSVFHHSDTEHASGYPARKNQQPSKISEGFCGKTNSARGGIFVQNRSGRSERSRTTISMCFCRFITLCLLAQMEAVAAGPSDGKGRGRERRYGKKEAGCVSACL